LPNMVFGGTRVESGSAFHDGDRPNVADASFGIETQCNGFLSAAPFGRGIEGQNGVGADEELPCRLRTASRNPP